MTPQRRVVDLEEYRAKRAGEGWVRKHRVAEEFSVSVRTVERWASKGMPHRKVGPRLVLYKLSEVDDWLEAHSA